MPDPPTVTEGGKAAWYKPSADLVQLPPFAAFLTPDHYYATLLHELGHATGHERRLNRIAVIGDIQFGSGTYGHEELVAELTSAFCCAIASLDNTLVENSAKDILNWKYVEAFARCFCQWMVRSWDQAQLSEASDIIAHFNREQRAPLCRDLAYYWQDEEMDAIEPTLLRLFQSPNSS